MLAIYTRLSVSDEASTSIENQLKEGKAFALKNNYKSYKIYNEGEGVSGGAEIKDRPQLFNLLQDINENNISVVWFRNQNRLERSSNTWHIFTTEAKKHNVLIYFNDKLFDFNNAQDNLYGTIQSALNQYQRDLQSAQTKKVLRMKMKEGLTWGITAYGYDKDIDSKLVIHKDESKVVLKMFKDSLSGIGTRTIALNLNESGVRTKRGTKFNEGTIYTILKNEIYKGVRRFANDVYEAPIIVEPELWQKVQDNFKVNSFHTGKKVAHKFILRGLLKCSVCDDKNYYAYTRNDNQNNYYMCSSKRGRKEQVKHSCKSRGLTLEVIESVVWHIALQSGELKKHIINHHKELSTSSDNNHLITRKDKINTELGNVTKKLLNAFDLITNTDDLDDDTRLLFNSKITTLQKNKKTLQNDLKQVDKELKVFNAMSIDINKSLNNFNESLEYSKLTTEAKKKYLNKVIKTIRVLDLKDSRHTLLAIYPKLDYDVEPMIVVMDYAKHYAVRLSGADTYIHEITPKAKQRFYQMPLAEVLSEIQRRAIESEVGYQV